MASMYKETTDSFEQFRKNFEFFNLNTEPNISALPANLDVSLSIYSTFNNYCSQSIENGHHYHVLIEVTKECVDTVNKMTPKTCCCSLSISIWFLLETNISLRNHWWKKWL